MRQAKLETTTFGAAVWLLFLLAAAGASSQPGPRAEPETEVVHLVFAWPPGLRGSVSATQTREETIDGDQTTDSATFRYSFQVVSEGENLRLDFDSASLETSDVDAAMKSMQADVAARLAELMPSYFVSKAGDFAGIHDFAAFQRSVQAMFDTAFKDLDPAVAQQASPLRDAMTSEAFLTSKAMEEWNAVVGVWTGAELEVGAEYVYSDQEPVPAFPGEEVLMNYTVSAKGFAPCRRGDEELRCVELEMRSSADPEDTRRLIEGFLAKLVGEGNTAAPVFTSLEIENVIVVLTEPATLVPHTSFRTRTIRGTGSAAGEESRVEQVDRTEQRYTYP